MKRGTPEYREQQRLYRLSRREQKREYDRAYSAANAERIRERARRWRLKNKKYKAEKDKEWRLNNADRKRENGKRYYEKTKDKFRAIDLKRNYGMTVEQYDSMLKAQNGVCAICFGVNKNGKRLAVDHDHNTGKVRELLCASCNLVIGHCRESAENLERAISYLRRHKPT